MSVGTLNQVYPKLSPLAQRILQILALKASGGTLSELTTLLKACGWGTAITKSGTLTQAIMKESLAELDRLQLIFNSRNYDGTSSIRPVVRDFCIHQAIRGENFQRILDASNQVEELDRVRRGTWYSSYKSDEMKVEEARQTARIAFYRGDVEGYVAARQVADKNSAGPVDLRLLNPFDADLFAKTPDVLKPEVLVNAVREGIFSGSVLPTVLEVFDPFAYSQDQLSPEMGEAWVHLRVARGDLKGLRELAEANRPYSPLAAGCLAFLTAQYEPAEAMFQELTSQLRKQPGKRNAVLEPLPGLMYALLLLRKNDSKSRATLKSLCETARKVWPDEIRATAEVIAAAIPYADNPAADSKAKLKAILADKIVRTPPLITAVAAHVGQWFLSEEKFVWAAALSTAMTSYKNLGLDWLVALFEDASVAGPVDAEACSTRGQKHSQLGTFPMLTWIQPISLWQRKLESLRRIADGVTPSKPTSVGSEYDERLIWELNVTIEKSKWSAELRPLIQKLSGRAWTKGRPVATERLRQSSDAADFLFLTEQDRAICKSIRKTEVSTGYYNYTETVYAFQTDKALPALVGHPFVFTPGNRTQPLEITSKRPQLVIRKTKSGMRLELDPRPVGSEKVLLIKDGAQRIVVVSFTPDQLKMADVLDGAIDIPLGGEDEVLATAKSLSALLSVESDVAFAEGTASTNVKTVTAEPRPHLHLLPFHAGVRAEFFVQPFGESGPFFAPGTGGENVFTDLLGESVSTKRDLRRETKLANEVVAGCPSLANLSEGQLSPFEFPTAEVALEMLLEIEPLREQGKLVIHWPQGQSLRVAGSVDAGQLRIKIARDRDWFAATGELVVNESLQLDMLNLMELIAASPGRFVRLSDGRFLALTERLRQRVAELAAFGEKKGDTLRFPPIRAAALSDLEEWFTVKSDKHWKACLKRIREAGDVVTEVPSTLNAELRDYQVEGFRWLCRLSHWGAGACLADDMGLGKTLQAIALLLHRGAEGPALVIAPTSVCFNWESELRRFAPTLNPRIFGAGDREAFFANLGPRDVVITSYGLLHNEAVRLQAVKWHTAILDEAQAIKNTSTKRSQAAMSLTADFRMIMTGTPIENHLGELWNLFQFINPGLLGSMEQYQQRFALPIERDQDRDVRQQLKRLVQPFLLRRTKTQVLSELPPRTEVTVPVTLSEEETLLYEAARQRAVQELTNDTDGRGRHVRILAEIMRLRRACCHPSLLMPDCGLTGAKLAAFSETIDELLENKHKALVFSQFVDHLSILRAELDRKGVVYQYLDGSTPIAERQRRVEAFQNGTGDVFLISLKAGGTGLNLTAADYVLHMDPWWNPAVEDQAADRAHRLGQLRPVTIYRFITRGTIEEKILGLHATKRDLADSLLEGTDTTGRLSAEELLELMR
jgi:superfamily II DNA or RNA helicase